MRFRPQVPILIAALVLPVAADMGTDTRGSSTTARALEASIPSLGVDVEVSPEGVEATLPVVGEVEIEP